MLGSRLPAADWLFMALVGGQHIRRLGRVGEVEYMSIRDSYRHFIFIFHRHNLSTHKLYMYLTLYVSKTAYLL